jgi:hypothetical protein
MKERSTKMRIGSQRARLTAAALVMAVAVPLAGCSGAASGNQNAPGGNAQQKAGYQKGGSQKNAHHKGSNNGYGKGGGGSY